ncbi:MAG: hypothetical protein Q8N37_03540 [bacterium]|nr:hypothetical protein [bacterium]
MNLFDKIFAKIKWLRTEPESVKVRYIWISALVVFAIVAILWVGLFRKYERRAANNGKSTELIIEEGKKLKEEINKIKIPDIGSPTISPSVSPESSPIISPETSPEASLKITPEPL